MKKKKEYPRYSNHARVHKSCKEKEKEEEVEEEEEGDLCEDDIEAVIATLCDKVTRLQKDICTLRCTNSHNVNDDDDDDDCEDSDESLFQTGCGCNHNNEHLLVVR